MRVLHLSDRASARGGADWHLLGVIGALAERGCTQLFAVGRSDGASVCETRVVRGLDAAAASQPLDDELDALWSTFRPDCIHTHNIMRADVLRWAAERGGVATVQDHRSFCPGRGKLTLAGEICREPMSNATCATCFDDRAYHQRMQRVTETRSQALRSMRALTVLSHYMKGELVAAGMAGERVHVISPFVHGLDHEAAAAGDPCVLFAGRLVEAKSAADALAAWQRAGSELPLVFAGTGSLRQRLEMQVQGQVELLGWVAHERMAELYARARVVLMPSRWQEPFGIVGLEALTVGTPVVAYDSGGVREWHPGGELLVPWGDVEALADALALALRDPPSIDAPSGFERDALMDRLLAVYTA